MAVLFCFLVNACGGCGWGLDSGVGVGELELESGRRGGSVFQKFFFKINNFEREKMKNEKLIKNEKREAKKILNTTLHIL